MLLVDTSAWIEIFDGSEVGRSLEKRITSPDLCLVPTLVQFELIKWMRRERGDALADSVLAFTQNCVVQPLDTQIAIAAADFSASHRLSTGDAIIYATARLTEAELLTCDAHFDGLQSVTYVRNKSA